MKCIKLVALIMVAAAICFFSGCASQPKGQDQEPSPESALESDSSRQIDGDAASVAPPLSELTDEEEALLEDDWDRSDELEDQGINSVPDPIEPFNRAIFVFNDKLYEWVLRPLSLGYRKVTPRIMRTGVQNFFTNLAAPIRVVNCTLQGKGKSATVEFGKFLINSTFGVLGFGDLFTDYPELYPDAEDLGQSLAVYGIQDGFYIVLPFLGSSTLRDAVGLAGDAFLDPVNYIDPTESAVAVRGFSTVNRLTFRIEDIDDARKAAFDPYQAARNFYFQSRRNRINK
jgi:phospholipid-binding lipoprotein MlaA